MRPNPQEQQSRLVVVEEGIVLSHKGISTLQRLEAMFGPSAATTTAAAGSSGGAGARLDQEEEQAALLVTPIVLPVPFRTVFFHTIDNL